MKRVLLALVVGLLAAVAAPASAATLDVTQPPYSAAGNGRTNDRIAIQSAIDAASAAGGGTVLLPAGRTFLSGGLRLKSHVTFQLDGTLKQSLATGDYATAPLLGWDVVGSTLNWDSTAFHNQPFLFAGDASDVVVTTSGSGTIQMGVAATAAQDIRLDAIGFRDVDGCWINNVTTRDVIGFNISLDRADNCAITGTWLNSRAGSLGSDGISISGSSHLRVLYNHVTAGDDGLYLMTSYGDPRFVGSSWRNPDSGGATRDVEIAHNDVVDFGQQNAFALLPWGSLAPDQRTVEISDVSVHDNSFTSNVAQAADCRCDNPWQGQPYLNDAERGQQSPMTRVSFQNNRFTSVGRVPHFPSWVPAVFTDSTFDGLVGAGGPMRSTGAIQNGGFERTGTAWWTTLGPAGATNDPATLPSGARTALASLGGWAGYLLPSGSGTSVLVQGLGLRNAADLGLAKAGVSGAAVYTLDATVVTSGQPFRLLAYDTCTGATLAQQTVTATTATRLHMPITVTSSCADVQVGLDRGSATSGWALIDDVELRAPVVDNEDPQLVTNGTWGRDWADDAGGTHVLDRGTGHTLTIPFTGTRGRVIAPKGTNWGIASIALDGGTGRDVDLLSAGADWHSLVYDTGVLPFGRHQLTITVTGRKNASSTDYWVGFDTLAVTG